MHDRNRRSVSKSSALTRRTTLGFLASAGLPLPASAQAAPAPRWLALPRDAVLQRIGFGSCLHQSQPQPIWRQVIAAEPQVFLMTGDNVYGDVSDASMKQLIAAYKTQAEQPELAAARAAFPFLATWDDHDYGLNDASAEFPHKAAARSLFAQFWGLPAAALPSEGVYRSEIHGPSGKRVQIILLDLRWFRSAFAEMSTAERALNLTFGKYKPDTDPARTMLGAAQWAWLEAELRKPAEVRILVSSIQVLAEAHGFERWGHFPVERARLLKLIADTGAKGVVLISGDRHRAAVYRRAADAPYPLYEVTSSSLNISRAGSEPVDPGRISPVLSEDNFGMVRVDWAARRLSLELMRASGIREKPVDIGFAELGIAAP